MYWIWWLIGKVSLIFWPAIISPRTLNPLRHQTLAAGHWPGWPLLRINIFRLRRDAGTRAHRGNTILLRARWGSVSIDVDLIKRVGRVELTSFLKSRMRNMTNQPHQSLFASPQNNDSFVHLYSNLKFTLHSDNKGHVHKNKFGFPPAPASRSISSPLRVFHTLDSGTLDWITIEEFLYANDIFFPSHKLNIFRYRYVMD